MNMCLVSIIIPIYNTEEFVEEAVRSIMFQTLKNIEIITINDGSTDNSLNIIEKLALEDNRIQIYTQENKGLSATRNNGIKYAKGKFIYFMDSDDYLEPEALEYCLTKCEQLQLDFISFSGGILNKTNNYHHLNLNYQKNIFTDDQIITGAQAFNLLIENDCYSPSACLNFIRYDFLLNINLLFHPGIIHEDQLFTTLLYFQAKKVSTTHKIFFKRRLRENSIMTKQFSMKNMIGYFTVTDQLLLYASNHPEHTQSINNYLAKMLNAAIWLSYKMPLKDRIAIAKISTQKYLRLVSIKNIFILLFKSIIKK